jgi:hypothetical protein
MQKADFDIATGAIEGRTTDLRAATSALERHRSLLDTPGVLGMWAGARGPEPYIMLAVQERRGPRLSEQIPDALDGVRVYYVEGRLHR